MNQVYYKDITSNPYIYTTPEGKKELMYKYLNTLEVKKV